MTQEDNLAALVADFKIIERNYSGSYSERAAHCLENLDIETDASLGDPEMLRAMVAKYRRVYYALVHDIATSHARAV